MDHVLSLSYAYALHFYVGDDQQPGHRARRGRDAATTAGAPVSGEARRGGFRFRRAGRLARLARLTERLKFAPAKSLEIVRLPCVYGWDGSRFIVLLRCVTVLFCFPLAF